MRMSQLQYKDCITIETLLKIGWKSNAIANYLGVHKSTISREVSNYSINGKYNGAIAFAKRQLLRALINKRKSRIVKGSLLENFILEKTKEYRSPEQIAGRWSKDYKELISKDTIYNYIYKHYPKLIKKYFRRKGKKYTQHRQKRSMIYDGRSIEIRPKNIDYRKDIGDWEGDSVEDGTHKARIITEVDRKTGYLVAGLSTTKNGTEISKIIYDMFIKIPKNKQKTMTLDQGMEFKDHKVIECTTGMLIYFCHKGAPWEKGTNENTNGLLGIIEENGWLNHIETVDLNYFIYCFFIHEE